MHRLLPVVMVLLLVGCSTPEYSYPLPEWPAEAPDVAIIGFAGRCNVLRGCAPPEENRAYLSEAPDPGTLAAIQAQFEQLGLSVISYSFRSHLKDSGRGPGYQSASNLLRRIEHEWIEGSDTPTRLVLVGHSHGNQFMSLLAWDNPGITFDYAIYLDAVCFGWDSDHENWFQEEYGPVAAYPAPLNITNGSACDSLEVPGVGDEDISDVVPWNINTGIEVRSNGMVLPGLLADNDPNHRPDGTNGDPVRLVGIHQTDEGHREVHKEGSAALSWVLEFIAANHQPAGSVSAAAQGVPLSVPAAPVGFELDGVGSGHSLQPMKDRP